MMVLESFISRNQNWKEYGRLLWFRVHLSFSYYRNPNSPYDFPVLEDGIKPTIARGRLKRLLKVIKQNLKLIGKDLELPMADDITFYWARHTYANVLRKAVSQ